MLASCVVTVHLFSHMRLEAAPLRILFIGNSFTYGPPPYDREDRLQLNNLPRMFKVRADACVRSVDYTTAHEYSRF